jgi:hypothetical protein
MCFLLMAGIAVTTAFGDERIIVLEAKILDTFDDDKEASFYGTESTDGTERTERGPRFNWQIEGSKFATPEKKNDQGEVIVEKYPRLAYVNTWPETSIRPTTDAQKANLKAIGINSSFTRRGYNWIDVYPKASDYDQKGIGFDIPGRIRFMDMWVWGSNLDYTLEAYFKDWQGMIRTVNFGSLAYEGWRDLQIAIPASFPQTKKVLPSFAPLRFIKFRIWTSPTEIVDQLDPTDPRQTTGVYIYFDQLKILTDTFETPYDGEELTNRDTVQEKWKKAKEDAEAAAAASN